MIGRLETIVQASLKLPIFPKHWNNYFYEYFNLREVGYSKKAAKEQAMKMTIWKYEK